ncbi:unnamed protein product [Candida parapsilosis]|uniref:DNA-directed RNA polymerase subunit n=2 Tax=Candida parapsilosis TaxID=5480 RepID=G8BBJ9_CANPC|nr:uncharacterized protein CPAR2_800660 [Candida parapsilosis]KAF6053088.1 SHS2 domain found in N terminus of Rpb7p/Rpc25p/MJ0397 family protein [Candida parapsilosis]KAF6053217.1 SHS2 domain found in N terminus of Rpb7p/Rpc25p/MJ0397 family protein [Candida parapsilosis]KAI5902148.1 DNA-directed RNA polymerase I subunit RPA43 [Candida parapsilosis]KAI5907700.1 DNA-directed RNA polymerase I subunit RPA43 [Candida parapsilosis]CAD1810431.1 unnamed protein product [Candida parapsilosis]
MSEIKRRSKEHHGLAPAKRSKTVKSKNPVNTETQLSECFKTVSTSLYVSLAPTFNNDPVIGIKQQHLDSLVMKFHPKLKGVVLSYSNIELETEAHDQNLAKIEGSSPFTFIWVNVQFLIWSPSVGDILEGDIFMQTPSHLGILICDVFNASIKRYNIPMGWSFTSNQQDEVVESGDKKSYGYWSDENGQKVDGKIKFTVKNVYTTGRVVSIEGTLIGPGEERSAQPVYEQKHSSKSVSSGKHKKFDDDEEEEETNTAVTTTEIPEPNENEDLPAYINNSENEDEDDQIVNKSDSAEDEVESD